MKINQTTGTNFSGFEGRTGSAQAPASYKIGQILEATVLASSRHGQVNLHLGNAEIMASTNIALQQNAHLSLKVMQLQPQLLLQILPLPGNTALQEAMKNFLPKQASLAPLLAELVHKSLVKETNPNQVALKNAGNVVVAALPGRSQMKQAEGLKQAILQSGLFLEAKLAKSPMPGKPGLSTDLKTLLLRYLSALSRSQKNAISEEQFQRLSTGKEILPPLKGRLPINYPRMLYNDNSATQAFELDSSALLKKLQAALARLGLLQVATVENMEDGRTLWQLEIPVRQGNAVETVALTIEKEATKASEESTDKAHWAVNLSLDLPQLGPLQSRISMDKLGLSTTFWSETPKALSLIETRLSELRAKFEQHGMEIHKLSCRPGQQTTPGASLLQKDGPLIDYQV